MSSLFRRAFLQGVLCFCVLLGAPFVFAQGPNFFITSIPGYNSETTPLRNNYTGFVGMQFTVNSPLYVTQLARSFSPGIPFTFSQSHVIKLVNAQTGVDIPNGSVTLTASNQGANFYLYAPLPAPILLQPNTSYLLLSQETAGGDSWYDYAPVTVASGAGTVTAAVYQDSSGHYIPAPGTAGYAYVPVNFSYSTVAPPPVVTITSPANASTFTGSTVTFSANVTPTAGLTVASVQFQVGDSSGHLVNLGPALTQAPYSLQDSTSTLTAGSHTLVVTATDSAGSVTSNSVQFYIASSQVGGALISGFSGTVVRNNYSGFVGLELTVGASPLTVISLGRIGLPGNSQTHTLKLVNEANGFDVPGGTVSLTMASGDGTTFQYAALTSPVTLSANRSYLLLSQELNGGDTWYDYSPVTGVASDASISGAVYTNSSGGYLVVPSTANYSYVPVNLITSVAGGGAAPGTISITSPANNSVFTTGAITFAANFTPTSGTTATSVQFLLNGVNYGSPITKPPYTLQVQSGFVEGANGLTAVGIDSGGNTITSANVTFLAVQDTIPFIQFQTQAVATATSAGNLSGPYYGMEFTVGPSPLLVTQLGFYDCCSFDSIGEFLKLVDAATGLDVPNGSVIAMATGLGGWGYSNLPAAVTLQANKSYYLVGQANPADYLLGPAVTPGSGATLNYPVYFSSNNTYVVATNLPGYSYAPVSFEFQSATPLPPAIAITAPAVNSTVSGLLPVTFTASAPLPVSVTSIQLQVDGSNAGAAITPTSFQLQQGAPLGVTLDTTALANGSHVLTAIATDTEGTQGTSAPVNISVNNAAAGPSNSPAFVTSFTPTYLRNNYPGFVGFSFTVGSVPIQISSLGRICVAGNSASHTVKLVLASNGSDVSGGSASVSLSSCTAGQFVYSALSSPLTLPAGSSYYLVDQETVGGDQWYDFGPIATASGATVNGPVYANGSQYVTVGAPGSSYVPLNFLFTSAPVTADPSLAVTVTVTPAYTGQPETLTATVTSTIPVSSVQFQIDGYNYSAPVTSAPFVETLDPVPSLGTHVIVAVAKDLAGNTAASAPMLVSFAGELDVINFTGTTPRNNYSGWVGFRLTTGGLATLLNGILPNVASVGRLCSAGNNMLHLVKLVNAATGTDVPTAAGWINMNGCKTGSYVDAILPNNIVLSANTSYYLVSQEFSGGDLWYDQSPAVPLTTVSTPVLPTQAEIGLFAIPTGANFTIDGPVYTAAGGNYVFVSRPDYAFVGLSIGGYSPIECNFGRVCGP